MSRPPPHTYTHTHVQESVNCSGVADAAYKRGVASASSVVAGAEGRAEAAEAQLAALRQEVRAAALAGRCTRAHARARACTRMR